MTKLIAADGHSLDAYEVKPAGARSAVVVIQEIFGVNSHIRAVVDGFAAAGYHAIAPALFDRAQAGVELEYTAEGVAAGRDYRSQLEWDDSMHDVAATVAHAAKTGPVGLVGYCYGGSIAWLAAHAGQVNAAVGYYGGQVYDFRDRAPQAPIMLHFGALDKGIPLDGVQAVARMYPDVPVHIYDDADHGFNCDVRASSHPESAAIARKRTMAFFNQHGVIA